MSQYPRVIFDGKISLGEETSASSDPVFFVQDFPLPRKETTWNAFPTKLCLKLKEAKLYQTFHKKPALSKPISRSDSPSFLDWKQMVQFAQTQIQKVVLCRKTTFTFDEAIDPYLVIEMLMHKSVNAKIFGLILSPQTAFVGATPELLVSRRNKKLSIDALAGTRPLGQESDLLCSEKDQREFSIVKKTIGEKLSSISLPFETLDEVYIKKTTNLCHLHYPYHVELEGVMTDSELIERLHPTPAISGYPSDAALKLIASMEPFDRGLYAGAIGISSESSSDIYVGIRSALIEENRLHLFAGAGIVQGSVAESEWQELENKIAQYGVL